MTTLEREKIPYVPILSVRPAEMVALRELPSAAKRRMLPYIMLRPWLGSGDLHRAMRKVSHAYGEGLFALELDLDYSPPDGSPLKDELFGLKNPAEGYAAWCKFVESYDRVIPSVIFGDDNTELRRQVARIQELGRGIAFRVRKDELKSIDKIESVSDIIDGKKTLIVIDFGVTDYRFLTNQVAALSTIRGIANFLTEPRIAISATSFPDSFPGIEEQEIYERSLYASVERNTNLPLIYSDRGSARIEKKGGGGVPAPRIDLPTATRWEFFRKHVDDGSTKEDRIVAYQEMAMDAIESNSWDKNLNIWGTQMIKLTQIGSDFGITSPVRSTAARINIHLFKQATSNIEGDASALMEDEWVD